MINAPNQPAILYRDDHIVVVNKPAGMAVHRSRLVGRDDGYLVDWLREALDQPAYLAHRIDRATSGCVLLALDKDSVSTLGEAFMSREVAKSYLAVVRGWPEPPDALIDHPIDGGPGKPEKREARTRYKTLGRAEIEVAVGAHPTARYALLECLPETGRYRQIRRHLKHISHHLIGDTSHGDGRHNRVFRMLGVHRMLLHAWRLGFEHPVEGRRIDVEAPLDIEFGRALSALNLEAPGSSQHPD
ncbi:MAG: pseudouridine synthase [Lysobacteraceae bacterium]|nr:pseudouridine synthase [Xanthomonadaceae bacterium]